MTDSQREELNDATELLHRQVHPNHVNEGRLTRIAFAPNSSDAGELSVDRGLLITTEDSYEAYVARSLLSAGTWSVSVAEVNRASLHAFEDPQPESPAHAIIDFGQFEKLRWKQASKMLADFAEKRGSTYDPRNP